MELNLGLTIAVLPGFRPERFTPNHSLGDSTENPLTVGLFELPSHLLNRWAASIDPTLRGPDGINIDLANFSDFAKAVIAFLRFKLVELSEPCQCDLVLVSPFDTAAGAYGQKQDEGWRARLMINLGSDAAEFIFDSAKSQPQNSKGTDAISSDTANSARVQLDPGQGFALGEIADLSVQVVTKRASAMLLIESK